MVRWGAPGIAPRTLAGGGDDPHPGWVATDRPLVDLVTPLGHDGCTVRHDVDGVLASTGQVLPSNPAEH